MPGSDISPPMLWRPPPDALETTRLGAFLRHVDGSLADYDELWEWSVDDLEGFWAAVAEFFEVSWRRPPEAVLASRAMPGATWFPGAEVSYAEHVLRAVAGRGDAVVVLSRSQTRGPVDLTARELLDQVARCRTGLQRLGVGRGDRVAAYLPNIHEAIVAFLATASLGAVWSSCGPEFGARSVLDRLSQIEPAVLVAADGYRYGATEIRRHAELAEIRAGLPSLRATVVVPYLGTSLAGTDGTTAWDDLLGGEPDDAPPVAVPFDHPLYILYSSGTTGLPKPIVHGHGGILLEHLKVLALHHDLGPDDRFFWFTTAGWMMLNYLVSGLLVGAAVVLFDGNPGHPDLGELWRMAEETGTTYFGTSAPYLLACRKAEVSPRRIASLGRLRGVGSTGAPLPPEGFRYVYEHVADDILLASVSGGTDVCSAFVGAAPLVPVWEGEISRRCLGAKVEAFSPEGKPIVGDQGELVITEPMPSMPVGFWNDPDGERYRAAYFDTFPGVWRHGDWITITPRGSCVITGRSDATLNRGGVRLGTSEFYSVVEDFPEVQDSLVVHLDDPEGGPGRLILFVVPTAGAALDADLEQRIRAALRHQLSPRHVPDEMHEAPGIPRTLSGKRLELPVKRILTGTPVEQAASRSALTDPDALDWFAALPRR